MLLLRWEEDPFSEKDIEFDFRNSGCEVKTERFEFQKPVKVNNGLDIYWGRDY